ncbi:MAG: hypothetical protein AB4080_15175 [Trichodesmium sp.]
MGRWGDGEMGRWGVLDISQNTIIKSILTHFLSINSPCQKRLKALSMNHSAISSQQSALSFLMKEVSSLLTSTLSIIYLTIYIYGWKL